MTRTEPESIAALGEDGILARILPLLQPHPDTPPAAQVEVGPGDDAAVLRLPSPRLVVTTDTLTEGHDFLLAATRPEWIGIKAATQNLADVAAMGAQPVAVVVAISAPPSTPTTVLEGISRGLAERCDRYGVQVVGGDLGAADALSVTITALGSLPQGTDAVLRSGAQAGDVLAVGTDMLGRSAAGLAYVLASRHEEPAARALVAFHNAPQPDLSLGWEQAAGCAHAMIDVSDGLVRDAGRLARASGVVINLDPDALSRDMEALGSAAFALGADPAEWVLGGGEEHALLATFAPGQVPSGFRVIGTVRAGDPSAVDRSVPGTPVLLGGAAPTVSGWDHFS